MWYSIIYTQYLISHPLLAWNVSRNINLNNKTSSFHELEITKWNLEKALEVRKILTFYAYFIVLTQSFQRWEFYSERVFEHVYAKKQEELRGGLLNWQLCLFCSPLNQRIVHTDHKVKMCLLKNSHTLEPHFSVMIFGIIDKTKKLFFFHNPL